MVYPHGPPAHLPRLQVGELGQAEGGDKVKLSIIIPLFHSRPHVGTLRTALGQTAERSGGDEWIWVSDGDGDYPGLPGKFIELPENKGFSTACNAGVKAARGEYVCLLNADTIPKPGWIEPLIAALDADPKLGIVGPSIWTPEGTLDCVGSRWDRVNQVWEHIGGGQPWHPDLDKELVERDMVTFACAVIRRSLWDELGGLDEAYNPAYWEDADFSMRARERGWKIAVCPQAQIVHVRGHSGAAVHGDAAKRNQERFLKTWVYSGRMFQFIAQAPRQRGKPFAVIRQGGLGDVVMVLSLVQRLHLAYPDRPVYFITEQRQPLINHPDIRLMFGMEELERPHSEWDILDLRLAYETRPKMHVFDAYLEAAGMQALNRPELLKANRPRLYPTLLCGRVAWELLSPGWWCAIHAGPLPVKAKNWPLPNWQAVIDALQANGWKVLVVGTEANPFTGVDLAWKPEDEYGALTLAALLGRCQLFIGVDSFPAHVAQAMDCRSVVLFGPTNPQRFMWGDPARSSFIWATATCSPCDGSLPLPPCTQPDKGGISRCMAAITPQSVLKAAEQLLPEASDMLLPNAPVAEIAASTVAPGMPSLRGHAVRRKLAEAGFKPGDKVRVTVTKRKV